MNLYASVAAVVVIVVVAMVYLLRTRRIREKYAAIWLLLTVAVVVLGIFPQLAFWLSRLLGVQTPVNLVFAVGLVVLAAVCLQLSTEVSNLEEETRTLAEEIALLRADMERSLEPGSPAAAGTVPDAPREVGATDVPGETPETSRTDDAP
jgi:hypothetical protein